MRKLYAFFGGIVIICLGLFWGLQVLQNQQSSTSDGRTLVIYNWGNFIDPSLLTKFTQETGISVDYQTFDSNESMYTKIKQGGTTYDLAVPSDYMIDRMTREDLLIKLDKSKIEGLDNISAEFKGLAFDPNNDYSIPYFWGTLGIVYNDQLVDVAPQEWSDLWSASYRDDILLYDGAREVLGLALNAQGDNVNSKSMTQLEAATKRLEALTPNIKAIVGDEMKTYMINQEAAIAVTFSGEASEMLENNSHLHYVVPSQGSNLWFDNLVIPKTAQHIDEAYAFINFMLRPENAAQNATYIGYATPNAKAKDLLADDIKNDKAFYPDSATISRLQVYENLGTKWLGIYNDLYLQFKMYRK